MAHHYHPKSPPAEGIQQVAPGKDTVVEPHLRIRKPLSGAEERRRRKQKLREAGTMAPTVDRTTKSSKVCLKKG